MFTLKLLIIYPRLLRAFQELGNPEVVYLAINADDSSIVYYKISQGIAKPPV
jgi:tRNA-splicing endonuclease subunit Sen15, fungi type